MGGSVLDPGIPLQKGLHVYAHSLRGRPGGVALLVMNHDRLAPRALSLPVPGERYTLDGPLQGGKVKLNGVELALGPGDALPKLSGSPTLAGAVTFAPATISFLALPEARNGG